MSEGTERETPLTQHANSTGPDMMPADIETARAARSGAATQSVGAGIGPRVQPAASSSALQNSPSSAPVRAGRFFWPPSTVSNAATEASASLARLTVIALFAITFLLQPFQIPSGSMEKTLLIGDFVLVNKQAFAPAGRWAWLLPYRNPVHGSLVVFHYPVNPEELLVKRVIATPGDRLHLRNNTVFLNGEPSPEPYAQYREMGRSSFRDRFPNLQEADPTVEAKWWLELRSRIQAGDLPIPQGRYFALGDNRNNSQDSRFWGFVPRENVVGEPMLVYLSIDHSGAAVGVRRQRLLRLLK